MQLNHTTTFATDTDRKQNKPLGKKLLKYLLVAKLFSKDMHNNQVK